VEYTLALIGTDKLREQVSGIDLEVELHGKQIKELGDKLERSITALEGVANDQIRDLNEKWRVEFGDFAEQSKLYDIALHDFEKLVRKVSPKGDGGGGFEKTFAAILSASQASLSARSALNTALLKQDEAKKRLAELQNRGKFHKQEPLPDVAIFENRAKVFLHFLGETEASVQDLEEQVKKVTEIYESGAKIDGIFKAWKDALEE
jgi:hypothetical protein